MYPIVEGMVVRKPDDFGMGIYGASRDGGKRYHKGTDYECKPGEAVLAPFDCKIVRPVRVYAEDDRWEGLVLQGNHARMKLMYVLPWDEVMGQYVKAGDKIGYAQDISVKYNKDGKVMTPHVHVEFLSVNPDVIINML